MSAALQAAAVAGGVNSLIHHAAQQQRRPPGPSLSMDSFYSQQFVQTSPSIGDHGKGNQINKIELELMHTVLPALNMSTSVDDSHHLHPYHQHAHHLTQTGMTVNGNGSLVNGVQALKRKKGRKPKSLDGPNLTSVGSNHSSNPNPNGGLTPSTKRKSRESKFIYFSDFQKLFHFLFDRFNYLFMGIFVEIVTR